MKSTADLKMEMFMEDTKQLFNITELSTYTYGQNVPKNFNTAHK
jgi:hypothetical protein